MIPLRLQLRNFLSYRDNAPPLLFDGFKLACLSGPNGHGKSALLDAMTWALWGKARARNDDELVHLGESDMEVQFDFQLGPNCYRVIRKRSFHGGRGAARSSLLLDFQVRDGDHYRSLAGNAVRETEREIVRRLRLDYDTFVNSAFILQGRADSFTTKPPNERKRILGELLGLEVYDELEERARARARDLEGEHRAVEQALAELERSLGERPRWETERDVAGQAVRLAEADLKAAEAELGRLRERRTVLEQRAQELAEVTRRLDATGRRLSEDERRLGELAAAVTRAEEVVARRGELKERLHARDALRRRVEELERLREERHGLDQQVQALRLKIEQASRTLAEERARAAEVVRSLRSVAAQRDALCQQVEALVAATDVVAATEAHGQELRATLAAARARQEQLRGENERLEAEGKRLAQQIELLSQAQATCPTCGGPLAAGERERIVVEVGVEREARRAEYRGNVAELKRLGAEAQTAEQDLAEVEQRLKKLRGQQAHLAALRSRLEQADTATEQLPAAESALAAVERQLAEGQYAEPDRAKLAEAEAALATLGYDADQHRQVREALSALADLDRESAELEQAARDVGRYRHELELLAERVAEQRAELGCEEGRAEALAREVADLPALKLAAQQQDEHCQDLAGQVRNARDLLSRAEQMLEHLARQERLLTERRAERARLAAERGYFAELAEAFSKRGVQAMLIEQVLPELEDEANALLARLTEGRMFVRFETQRAARSGEGVIETLDIRISDELGLRSYELYSGGEAFRVNFAIRVALSKLLARRAGAQVQMLVIDEGFGTQDERGRERLVEAIKIVSDDFEKVLVITHVDELKDFFPVRIEVTKSPESGSQFVVI